MIYTNVFPPDSITDADITVAEIRELARGIHTDGCQMADPGGHALKLFLLLHMADEDLKGLIIDVAIDYFFSQTEQYTTAQIDALKEIVDLPQVIKRTKRTKKRGKP